jgi:hypothetical protein
MIATVTSLAEMALRESHHIMQHCSKGMFVDSRRHRSPCWFGIGPLSLILLIGCGDSGPSLIPVAGRVTIDGKPATEGGVVFRSVSNEMVQLIGSIQPDGMYSIMHNRNLGAPAGEYRVAVLVTETQMTADGKPTGLPRTLSNRKFSDPKSTPLKIEVKENAAANAYDLAVTS